jgi:hypothetical protein
MMRDRLIIRKQDFRIAAHGLRILPDVVDIEDSARQTMIGPFFNRFQEVAADLGALTNRIDAHARPNPVGLCAERILEVRVVLGRHLRGSHSDLLQKPSIPSDDPEWRSRFPEISQESPARPEVEQFLKILF